MKYFAYGSNLNVEQMQWRCRNAVPLGPYTLEGYSLVFRFYADITPVPGKSVKGGLWEITEEHEELLDRYEGYPELYGKYYEDDIMFYRMREDAYDLKLPTLGYLGDMLEGMENFGFSLLEDLNKNLGNPPIKDKEKEGDLLQNAMRLIAESMGIDLIQEVSMAI